MFQCQEVLQNKHFVVKYAQQQRRKKSFYSKWLINDSLSQYILLNVSEFMSQLYHFEICHCVKHLWLCFVRHRETQYEWERIEWNQHRWHGFMINRRECHRNLLITYNTNHAVGAACRRHWYSHCRLDLLFVRQVQKMPEWKNIYLHNVQHNLWNFSGVSYLIESIKKKDKLDLIKYKK